jgi:hypothetical protein
MNETSTFFEPHVGSHYAGPKSLFDKRVLVLGDSHYCGKSASCVGCGDSLLHPECRDFTVERVSEYLDENFSAEWKKTYSTFINSVFGHRTSMEERSAFFDSVVFANYLQVAAGGNPYSKVNGDYDAPAHLNAFYACLERVLPEIVVCWGGDVWDALPNDWGYGEALKAPVEIEGDSFASCYIYPYRDSRITLLGANHPCRGFPSDRHHQVFKAVGMIPRDLSRDAAVTKSDPSSI